MAAPNVSPYSSLCPVEAAPYHSDGMELWVRRPGHGTSLCVLLLTADGICHARQCKRTHAPAALSRQPTALLSPTQAWYALVYAVFIASALCYLLLTWSNLHIASSVVTAFWPLQVSAAPSALPGQMCQLTLLLLQRFLSLCCLRSWC